MNEILEMAGELLFDFLGEVAFTPTPASQPPSPEEQAEWNELLAQHAMYSSPEKPLGLSR